MGKVTVGCIGSFPPPVQGAAIINEGLYARLQEQNIPASRIDLSPGRKQWRSYHLTRSLRTLRGVLSILFASGPRRYLMSIYGGGGAIYNILLAMATRARDQPRLLYNCSPSYLHTRSALMQLLLKIAGKNTFLVAWEIECSHV